MKTKTSYYPSSLPFITHAGTLSAPLSILPMFYFPTKKGEGK
ncbi:MAG: hypothetical protein PVH73_06490 [Candidatus Bathyarchaeota archaeon]|jgi:hypothetical protein